MLILWGMLSFVCYSRRFDSYTSRFGKFIGSKHSEMKMSASTLAASTETSSAIAHAQHPAYKVMDNTFIKEYGLHAVRYNHKENRGRSNLYSCATGRQQSFWYHL